MPFFSDDRRGGGLKTVEVIEVLVSGRGGICICLRPRDLGFSRVIELGLSLFSEKGLKKNNISWKRD